MDSLYKALKYDSSDTNALRRSPNRLIDSIQNYRRANKLPLLVEGTDAYRQVINRILNRKMPNNPMFIGALWDFLVYENLIVDSEAGDELSQIGHRLHDFFHEAGRNVSGPLGLVGWYYGYKPAIRDPDRVVLKYLVQIKSFSIFSNLFVIKEFHFNRSFKPPSSEVITEYWDGVLVARSSSTLFGIIREIVNGTPKNVTLHSPQPDSDGLMIQIFGDSLEIVEKWGRHTTLPARLMLERIYASDIDSMSDDDAIAEFGKQCDLIDWRIIFNNTRYDIISQIMPGISLPATTNNN